jgi:hypothetical protein
MTQSNNIKRVELSNATGADEVDVVNRKLIDETFRGRVARHLLAAGAASSLVADLAELYGLGVLDTGSPTRAASRFLPVTDAAVAIVDAGGGGGFVDAAITEYLGGHDPRNVVILVRRMGECGVTGPARALVAEHMLALIGATDRSLPALRPVWAELDRLGSAIAMARRGLGTNKVSSALPELVNAWLSGRQMHLDEAVNRVTATRGKTVARAFAQAELRARAD